MSRILIAGGGTAGHVVPALAVADVLRADGHDVGFCGAGGIEKRLVPREGYDLSLIHISEPTRLRRISYAVFCLKKKKKKKKKQNNSSIKNEAQKKNKKKKT